MGLLPGQGQGCWPDPRVYSGGLQADAERVVVREKPREKAHLRDKVLQLWRQQQEVRSRRSFAGGGGVRSPPFSGEVLGINPAPVEEELSGRQVREIIVKVACQETRAAAEREQRGDRFGSQVLCPGQRMRMRVPWSVPVEGNPFEPVWPFTNGRGLDARGVEYVSSDEAREGSHGCRADKSNALVPSDQGSGGAWPIRCNQLRSRLQFPEEVGFTPRGQVRFLKAPGDSWVDQMRSLVCRPRGVGRKQPLAILQDMIAYGWSWRCGLTHSE